MVGRTDCIALGRGRSGRTLVRGGLLLAVALLISLAASARAEAECLTPNQCFDAANWKSALADAKVRSASELRAASRQKSNEGIVWRAAENQARERGDADAAAWYKALADRLFSEATYLAAVANQRSNEAVYLYAAARANRDRGFYLLTSDVWDVGPSYPEGILEPTATAASKYNCTGSLKTVKNKRDIEAGWVIREKLFWYRIETSWRFCNGEITLMEPAVATQDVYTNASDVGWRFVKKEKVRPATCYGPGSPSRGNPERCAWSYKFYWRWERPSPIPDRERTTCVTTQVKGNGAHYRHGGCDLKSWTGSSWGGGEY